MSTTTTTAPPLPTPSTTTTSTTTATTSTTANLAPSYRHGGFVDVHAHVFHEMFQGDEDAVHSKCSQHGLEYVIVNGLEPKSNREVLELCQRKGYNTSISTNSASGTSTTATSATATSTTTSGTVYLPALGIYPLDAACNVITDELWKHDFERPAVFDVDGEVAFIGERARNGEIVAIGECGLDSHYLTDAITMAEQERVLDKLCDLSLQYDLPLILHSRKAEARTFQKLLEKGVKRADFHCFCGKTKLGAQIAAAGYYLSIPAVVERSDSFKQLVSALPLNRILTETDCPYQGPDRADPVTGPVRNDPSTVPRGVVAIAKVRFGAKPSAAVRQSFDLPDAIERASYISGMSDESLRALLLRELNGEDSSSCSNSTSADASTSTTTTTTMSPEDVINHSVVAESVASMDRAQLVDLDYVIRQIRHNFRELFKL